MYIHHKNFYWNPSMRKEGHFKNIFCVLSGYPKKPVRTEKPSIFNIRYVKEVWASGLLGVKSITSLNYNMTLIQFVYLRGDTALC